MKFTQLLLVLLGVGVAQAHFKQGGDFAGDCKKREDTCKPLVECPNKGSGSSESGGGDSGEGSASGLPSGSGSGSGSGCDFSGEFGSGFTNESGSWEFGSGSGNCSGSGSGSEEISGSGISGSGSGSGIGSGEWEEGQYCFLFEVFLNYSIILEVDIRIIFIQWINETQLTIVQNSEFTEYEVLVHLYYSLQILFEQYSEIKIAFEFLYIGEWGYVCDLEGLITDIQTDYAEITIEQVIEIDITTGSCPLIEALNECSQNASSSDQAAIQILIQKITVIINGYYSFSETLVLIYQEFSSFFIQYPNLQVLIFSVEIEQFGLLQSYFDICTVYWRIENFSIAVGGSTSSCELLISLNELWQNTSYSTSQRQDFKQLYTKITAYFEIEITVELRIQYFTEQTYQLLILAEWDITAIYQVEIKGYGNIYQLIYAYTYSCNHGVTPGDFTVSAEPSTSTVTSTSTSTSTSTPTTTKTSTSTSTSTSTPKTSTSTTTTTTKPTTPAVPVCSNAWSVNTVKNNMTDLLSSIISAQSTWTVSEKNTFLGYQKKIYSISVNSTTTYSTWWKFNDVKKVILNFASSTTTLYKKVQAVYIVNWGPVSAYCNCGSSGTNATQG